MVSLDDVIVSFADSRAPVLDRVSLHIGAGGSVAVMGANGSGKSTLAAVIAGLLKPRAGRVTIDAINRNHTTVGVLFQNPDNQMVATTVEKEVAFALENSEVPLAIMEAQITATLERFRISHLRTRLTNELSGGEKQRVALASVMVQQPPVLILDEPDSFLDEAGRRALQDELARLHQAQPDLVEIRITQYSAIARRYPRLVVLHRGRVVADGSPPEIFADHSSCVAWGIAMPDTGRFSSDQPRWIRQTPRIATIAGRNLGFRYGGNQPLLSRLDLDLTAGQCLGIVGPSGAGKSTLAMLACGLLPPDEGTVVCRDAAGGVISWNDSRGRVVLIMQQPERQFFLPTCREEVAFGPNNLGQTFAPDQADQMLRLVGLDPGQFSGRDPFTLSEGEKRRLAFAAVLSMAPDVVLFDEPTCALDQEGVARFLHLAQSLKSLGVVLAVITHEGQVLRRVADNILYLRGSGEHELWTTERFFAEPLRCSLVSN